MVNATNNVNTILTSNNYELNIISRDEIANGKTLKQYNLNNEKVVGVYPGENFIIQFKNNTWNRVGVRISIDGTDILKGGLADTNVNGEMFICQPYGKLELKGYPETNKGGSEFVFGKIEDSVAINTHGIKTGIGYVACAIFVEEVQNSGGWINTWPNTTITSPKTDITWIPATIYTNNTGGTYSSNSIPFNSEININSMTSAPTAQNVFTATTNSCDLAVGAGEYVNQEITKVAGLNKPILGTTISIRYKWWVALRSEIRQINNVTVNPAFPGDQQVVKMIDLKNTPRKKKGKKVKSDVKYPELSRFV